MLLTKYRKIDRLAAKAETPTTGPNTRLISELFRCIAPIDNSPVPASIDPIMGSLASTIPNTNERSFRTFSHLHYFGNFLGVHFTHRTTMYAEILGKAVHTPAVDGTVPCNDTIAQGFVQEHIVIHCPMSHEGVNFNKGFRSSNKSIRSRAVPRPVARMASRALRPPPVLARSRWDRNSKWGLRWSCHVFTRTDKVLHRIAY